MERLWGEGFQPGEIEPLGIPEPFPDHTWEVPFTTTNISNIKISVTSPWVTAVHLPASEEDWEVCDSAQENSGTFASTGAGASITEELTDGDASILGPYDAEKGAPHGEAELASTSEGCDVCSFLSFTDAAPRLEALVLDSLAPTNVGWTNEYIILDEFRVALYAPVDATQVTTNTYRVAPGDAMFSLNAFSVGSAWSLTARNDDAIEISYNSSTQTWTVSQFEIHYDDGTNDTWILTINNLEFGG